MKAFSNREKKLAAKWGCALGGAVSSSVSLLAGVFVPQFIGTVAYGEMHGPSFLIGVLGGGVSLWSYIAAISEQIPSRDVKHSVGFGAAALIATTAVAGVTLVSLYDKPHLQQQKAAAAADVSFEQKCEAGRGEVLWSKDGQVLTCITSSGKKTVLSLAKVTL